MALTDVKLKKAKAKEKQYRLSDAGGLYALVQPSGAIWWRFDYSRPKGGRNTMSLGTYPKVSLKEAREKQSAAQALLTSGIDPVEQAKAEEKARKESADDTFKKLAEDYVAEMVALGRSKATLSKAEWLLYELAVSLHPKAVKDITPADILPLLTGLQDNGLQETAHRLRGIISRCFRFAVSKLRAENDPTWSLRGSLRPVKVKSYAAIVKERPFGGLLRTIDDYDGWPTLKAALQLLVLCYPRPGELRHAEWSDFKLTAKVPVWTIPAHIAKMRREHDIPLSRQAVEVLTRLKRMTGNGKLAFPSLRHHDRPLSENTINAALRRMGYTKEEHCSHGFRSSASSILNGRKFDSEVIERSLAHLDANEVRRVYNRYEYWDERVELAQAWADLCDELKRNRRRDDDLI